MKKSSLKLFSFLFLISLTAITFLFACSQTEAKNLGSTPWLHVNGVEIQNPDNQRVILRGVSLPDISIHDHRRQKGEPSKSAVELIDLLTDRDRGWYSTVIRLPVYPESDRDISYNNDPNKYYQNYLQPAIDECVKRKVYCIIDWHYVDDPQQFDAQTRAFWSEIAPKYKDYANVIFELFNEPKTDISWSEWKNIVQPWIDIIRDAAPRNLILAGAPHYSQHLYDAPYEPLQGENIVYVGHIYPGLAQHLWDKWVFNVAEKLPLFITEWGFRNGARYPTSGTISNYGIPLQEKLEKYNLSWVCWVADYNWQPEMFDRDWNLLVGEDYMGGFVKDYLAEKSS